MSADAPDERRTSRRDAMRTALAGAATLAGARWQAPRIEGLSVAPDVAQAATCTPASGSASHDAQPTSNPTQCWGQLGPGGCETFTGTVTVSENVVANVNIVGVWDATGNSNGQGVVQIPSIEPFLQCTGTVEGVCTGSGGPVFTSEPPSFVYNQNGESRDFRPTCSGVAPDATSTATVTLNVSCICP